MLKKKVTFNVSEELYFEYKKALIDQRTTPTADFARHMFNVVEKAKKVGQFKETEENNHDVSV